ncbi:titin-like [Aricia agestis]|uniref:titin-like n=1 Tax=Aricia agestis TaxID=91739 RepID=UPI001C205403|nr:titin-like [Aricia agestis]
MSFPRQHRVLCLLLFAALPCDGQTECRTVSSMKVAILGSGPLSENKPSELKCRVTGAGPHTNVTWWWDRDMLPATIFKDPAKNVTASLLQLTPSRRHDSFPLRCRAENKETNETVETELKMDVHYAPRATLILGEYFDNDALVEDNDIYFTCSIKANPPARIITWEHNGVKIKDNVNDFRVTRDSLVLQKLSPSFNGRYTCEATNDEGTGVSRPYNLRIRHKPLCKYNEPKMIAAKLLEPVKIDCEVEAFPSLDAFQWAFKYSSGRVEQIDREKFTVAKEQGRSVLTYTPTSEADYGTLQCWAANSQGQQQSPCTYIIRHPTPPQAPIYCVLYPADAQKTLLACTPDSSSSGYKANITYKAEIMTNTGKKILPDTTFPYWELDNFDGFVSKEIILYATNEFGESKRTFAIEIAYRLIPSTGKHNL